VGLTDTGGIPEPLSVTYTGLLGSVSLVIASVALLDPVALGVKVILSVQEDFHASVGPHVVEDCTKSLALVPVKAMGARVAKLPVLFVTVTVFAMLTLPRA
jgi:hypothetical protein